MTSGFIWWRMWSFLLGAEWYARKVGVKIGAGCRIYSTHFGSEPFLVSIGNRVTVTSGVRFVTHDGATCLVTDSNGRRFDFAPIVVGDDVFIGVNSIVLPGVTIGSRCVIGAGSVVTRSIPDDSVVAGVPARLLGDFATFRESVLATSPSEAQLPSRTKTPYREWVAACIKAQNSIRSG